MPSWADTCNTRRVAIRAVQKRFMCFCFSVPMIAKNGLCNKVSGELGLILGLVVGKGGGLEDVWGLIVAKSPTAFLTGDSLNKNA